MRNIRLQIEYDGAHFQGWQVQNNSPRSPVASHRSKTIQETIEEVLEKILQEKVKVIASGRTDAGVHALAQVANFKTSSDLTLVKIQKALNSLLPKGIAVKKIRETSLDFHSRYCAKYKLYRYLILNSKIPSVFLRKFSWQIPYKLDIPLMRKEAKALLGRQDFSSFCASGSSVKSKVRKIRKISLAVNQCCKLLTVNCKLLTIDIEADGFLYNMVRNIVGTLVEIGRGKMPAGSMRGILSAKNRSQAGPAAPANGLFLIKVKY